MGMNVSIEGSNPSFSALRPGGAGSLAITGETMFPPWAPFFAAAGGAGVSVAESAVSATRRAARRALRCRYDAPAAEGWQSGRMRRSRKPFRALGSDEGSNPSPSALFAHGSRLGGGIRARQVQTHEPAAAWVIWALARHGEVSEWSK